MKGPWDGESNRRAMVALPPLKPEQERRPVYFYRSDEQNRIRLKQFDDKLALLDSKKAALAVAEAQVPYQHTVLTDTALRQSVSTQY